MLKENINIISSCTGLHDQSISLPCQAYIHVQIGKPRHQEIEIPNEVNRTPKVQFRVVLFPEVVFLCSQAVLEDF